MPTQDRPAQRLRVEEFEVNLRSREVRRSGTKIKLQTRPFQILAELLQRPGEVVTREEIRKRVWPDDTFVDFEHGINTAVNKLREAFGDDAENPRFIETLPRLGYRFIARVEPEEADGTPTGSVTQRQTRFRLTVVASGVLVLLAIAFVSILSSSFSQRRDATPHKSWVQITDFADSATSPALSPDGRMLAFIRGPETFVTPGQIYVKMLPDGQPVQLTHDDSVKMAPTFSPDGTRIAYTAIDDKWGWNTWVVSVFGGQPQELLPNAAALTWTDAGHVMFSEIKTGVHMGIATSTESRAEERDVYLPAYEFGMAHRSSVSPDGKWVLVSEMNMQGWLPCQLVPFDGATRGEIVGPNPGQCTSAAWSPDGKTLYFSTRAGEGTHIWRQRFPTGVPEQLTFGPTEEEGVAVSPDGSSLVTSVGIEESTVWVHDARGDRQVSGEGYASLPGLGFGGGGVRNVFSPDGKRLYYLVRNSASQDVKWGQLWMTELDSGRSELVLPGVWMSGFDLAPDGSLVTFTVMDEKGNSHLWMAPLDRSTSPKQLTSMVARSPFFGAKQEVYFTSREGEQDVFYTMGVNEATPRKVDQPEEPPSGLSSHTDWWVVGFSPVIIRSKQGGTSIQVCSSCSAGWAPNGRVFYLFFRGLGVMGGQKTIALALPPGQELPTLPAGGVKSANDIKGLNVVAEIDMKGMRVFAPGPDPSIYAYVRASVQRNLYRIPLQ